MFPKKNNKFWALISLVVIIISLYFLVKNTRDVEVIVRNAGVFGPLVVLLIYAVVALTPIPSDPITVINIALFGPVLGFFISWMGNNIGALMEYYFGAHLSKTTNFKDYKEKLPFGLNKLPVNSPWFLIGGRLIPGYGGKVISIIAGMYRVSVTTFFWTTALTNFLGAILLGFGGYGIINIIHTLKL